MHYVIKFTIFFHSVNRGFYGLLCVAKKNIKYGTMTFLLLRGMSALDLHLLCAQFFYLNEIPRSKKPKKTYNKGKMKILRVGGRGSENAEYKITFDRWM